MACALNLWPLEKSRSALSWEIAAKISSNEIRVFSFLQKGHHPGSLLVTQELQDPMSSFMVFKCSCSEPENSFL